MMTNIDVFNNYNGITRVIAFDIEAIVYDVGVDTHVNVPYSIGMIGISNIDREHKIWYVDGILQQYYHNSINHKSFGVLVNKGYIKQGITKIHQFMDKYRHNNNIYNCIKSVFSINEPNVRYAALVWNAKSELNFLRLILNEAEYTMFVNTVNIIDVEQLFLSTYYPRRKSFKLQLAYEFINNTHYTLGENEYHDPVVDAKVTMLIFEHLQKIHNV